MGVSEKYQVFIGSTYKDLREEREAVTWELMKSYIPAGMEAFTATNDRGWEIIQRTIDDSDYYVLIVAGCYGDFNTEWQQSWTHREYEYARSRGIPILAFIREKPFIPSDKNEEDPKQRERLAAFTAKVREHHFRPWTTEDNLVKEIILGLQNHIRVDERSERKRPGWSRVNVQPREKPVPTICPMKNWAIVSQHSPFTDALRDALKKKGAELGIVESPEFKLPADQHSREYSQLLHQFLDQAPDGSWLFTNYAEDALNFHSEPEQNYLVERLARQNKLMICFESGHNLLRAAGEGNNPVGVIDTNASHAIQHLVKHMTNHVWRNSDIRQLEIVSMMGPQAANLQERGLNYLEFFACMQHGKELDIYKDVPDKLRETDLYTTVIRPLRSLFKVDCKPEILKFLEVRKPTNESDHITFVCGNDDLASFVYEAVKEKLPIDVEKGRVSFVGFDGLEPMRKMQKELKPHQAVTAWVKFDEMVNVAERWLTSRSLSAKPYSVLAEVY